MRVYFDTGVFIDYLIYRDSLISLLRNQTRRGRSLAELSEDVTNCLQIIARNHEGFTSAFTLYEVEKSMLYRLRRASSGIDLVDKNRYLVNSARLLFQQTLAAIQYHNFRILDLTENDLLKKMTELEIAIRNIKPGDSLHIATAILHNAELIISTDRDLLRLNNIFTNNNGLQIHCCDTDQAVNLL